MCGIAGAVNVKFDKYDLSVLNHRGPDSSGIISFKEHHHECYLGQTRLSIVDLSSAGFQPMTDVSGRYTIVLNGEIYNHLDLRKDILNVSFKGHSDTETVLYYLIQNGIKSVDKFNGIFAFCFYDSLEKQMYLGRDPFGVKPLYYYINNYENQFIFSSEIKFIKKIVPSIEVSTKSLYVYLRLRFCPSPLTFFHNVFKVRPGHLIQIDLSNPIVNHKEYFYSYVPVKNHQISLKEAENQYKVLLEDSIKRQLMSDVPIAVMLSGGIDSALLAYFAQKNSKIPLNSYCIGFDFNGISGEELEASDTAELINTKHKNIKLTSDNFKDTSILMVELSEEPVGSQSTTAFYKLSKSIHQDGFKVALSGQGVDEAMAGYSRHRFQILFDRLASPSWSFLKYFLPFIKDDKIRRGVFAICETNRAKRYLESYSFFDSSQIQSILNIDNFQVSLYESELVELIEENAIIYGADKLNGLDYMLVLDARMALSDDLLLYTDKISMKNSLEVRVPFLDLELMKFVESLPTNFKIKFMKLKYLHKKAAEEYLPSRIINRRKNGFYIPREEWYKSHIGADILNDLKKLTFNSNTSLNLESLDVMFEQHMAGKYDYQDQIYSLLNLAYWANHNS